MAKVVGLGGVFFTVKDKAAWADWYRRVLGVEISDWGGAMWPHERSGYTLLSGFAADTDYMAPSTRGFMVNLVVDDLDGVLALAKAAGVEPMRRDDGDEHGRFAWLLDPEDVKVELWQPPAKDAPSA